MSWILGCLGFPNTKFELKYNDLSSNAQFAFNKNHICILSGGYANTNFFGSSNHQDELDWVTVGMGFHGDNHKYQQLNSNSWNTIIQKKQIESIFGHFVVVSWNSSELNIFTDKQGLRDIHYLNSDGTLYFSTMADWLAKIVGADIDFRQFGSRWLLINHIGKSSIFTKIKRLVLGASLNFNLKTREVAFSPDVYFKPRELQIKNPIEEFRNTLNYISTIPLKEKHLSLSLSGGLDSRVIFSSLLKSNSSDWDAHSFGNPAHPDSKLAKMISDHYNVIHHQYNYELKDFDKLFKKIEEYIGNTLLINPASEIIQLKNYDLLPPKTAIVDGGFGEIWRREFLNRLRYLGMRHLLSGDIIKIIPFLELKRPKIFNEEICGEMFEGTIEQIEDLINSLPDIKKVGADNWLDLFALNTRLINLYGPEQARLDHHTECYMPFIQLPLMNIFHSISADIRRNGKLFRKVLKSNQKSLSIFPLVKGYVTHPFFLNSISKRIYSTVTAKFSKQKNYLSDNYFWPLMMEYLNDTFTSLEVKNFTGYDQRKIKSILDDYNKGVPAAYSEIDWLLSFELFRNLVK